MKSHVEFRILVRATVLAAALSSLATSTLLAGPGIAEWKSRVAPATSKAGAPQPPAYRCAASREDPIVTMAPAWRNGRGPLRQVVIGTRHSCDQCKPNGTAMISSWRNARGPLAAAPLPSRHDCDQGCVPPRTSVRS